MGKYIHGFHVGSWSDHHIDAGWQSTGAHLMADHPGILVFTELVGDGHDYRVWHDAGYTVLVRLNHAYGTGGTGGTIPPIAQYADFAQRCATMVAASRGVDGWILGNEVNASFEWPDGVPITAEDYAICFDLCRTAIQITTPDAQVLIAGIAPYNADSGDWVEYLEDVMDYLAQQYDGIVLHCYTHGHDPTLITSTKTMDTPHQNRHYEFRAYRDFMSVIPDRAPVWITETNPGAIRERPEWEHENNGWVQEAYAEINNWNRHYPARQIRGLCLYRYPRIDRWWIQGNAGVEADFAAAVAMGYEWIEEDQPVTTIIDGLDSFYDYNDDGHLQSPLDWVPVWLHNNEDGVLDRPEFKKAGSDQTRTGAGAAAIHGAFSTLNGALRRSFNVGLGEGVRAGVYVRKEAVEGNSGIQIGIDPTGQGVINEDRIEWSEWYSVNSPDWKPMAWRLREVETIAQGNVITVFLRAKNDQKVRSHYHFDDFTLTTSGVVPPDPPPTGTWRTVTYDPAGHVAGEFTFEGPSVNPQICAHAQAIVGLTCP